MFSGVQFWSTKLFFCSMWRMFGLQSYFDVICQLKFGVQQCFMFSVSLYRSQYAESTNATQII